MLASFSAPAPTGHTSTQADRNRPLRSQRSAKAGIAAARLAGSLFRVSPPSASRVKPSNDMTSALPSEVVRLLDARGSEAQESAWAAFLGTYNGVLLRASHSLGPAYDGAMDRYAHVLEALRCDDFRRLQVCAADPPADFSVWLSVVARRLSLDHYRARYGRARKSPSAEATARRTTRRRVEDPLTGTDPDLLPDERAEAPDEALTRSERKKALDAALAGLPPRDYLLLRFRFDESCSATEIARLMDFPTVFHVYRRINAVLAALRRSLGVRGIDSA